MKEELVYTDRQEKGRLFVHKHIPENSNGKLILFFNPIFDEKKRVQRFQAETARALCSKNYNVVRFDYFGTGDSEGQLYEFNLIQAVNDSLHLGNQFKNDAECDTVIFLGIRIGADLAFKAASLSNLADYLILIEPVISGKHYITEQRTRRKAFFKFNNIDPAYERIEINGDIYEDHQGYPISKINISFLEDLDIKNIEFKVKKIILCKLDFFFSNKRMMELREHLSSLCDLNFLQVKCPDFWSSLEEIDTKELTDSIIQNID